MTSCLQNTHSASLHCQASTPFSSSRRTLTPAQVSARAKQDKNVPNGRQLAMSQKRGMVRNISGHHSKFLITARCNSPALPQLRSRQVPSGTTTAKRMTSCCSIRQHMYLVRASSYHTHFDASTTQLHASFLGAGFLLSLDHHSKTVRIRNACHCHASLMAGPIASISGGSLPSVAAGALALTAAKLQSLAVTGGSSLVGLAELYMPYVPAVVAPLASAWSGIGAKS